MLEEIKVKMEDLSSDEDAMAIEHEFADEILGIIDESHWLKPKSDKTDEERLEEIKAYCEDTLENTEYDILIDWAEEILKMIG